LACAVAGEGVSAAAVAPATKQAARARVRTVMSVSVV
jgi:hypothetical protein